jgi:O-antigen/teichoic acid export membrane protein
LAVRADIDFVPTLKPISQVSEPNADSLLAFVQRILPKRLHPAIERIGASPLASRLAHGSFWSLAGSVAARALALCAAIVAARIIGKSPYGELGIVQTTISLFVTLAGFGLGTTATKYVAEYRTKDPAKAGRIIALSSVMSWATSTFLALVLYAMSPWLSSSILAAPQLKGPLQLSALLLFLNGVNGAQNGVLSGFEAFKAIANVTFLAGLLNFPLVVGGAWFFGLEGLIWGLILAQAAGCLMNYLAVRRAAARFQVPIRYASWQRESGVIWQFAFPSMLGGLMMNLVIWTGSAMLARQPEGYAHMGAFNAATQWMGALIFLPQMLAGVVLPILAERMGGRDHKGSIKLLAVAIKINALTVLPLVLVGSLLSPFVMATYGSDFRRDWPTLIASLATAGVVAVQLPVGLMIAASGRMWIGFVLNLGWAVVFLLSMWLLLDWGSLGLASAQLLAYVAQGLCAFAYVGVLLRRIRHA